MDAAPAPAPPSLSGEAARRGDAWLAFALALAVLAVPAWARDLWDADEGRYAAVALDMRRSGDFVTPRQDGMRFLDKPPLVYWAENAAFTVLGTNAFAARLPCVVAGAALAALAFLFGAAWTGRRAVGFGGAAVAATSLAGVGFSRTVTMDMPLAASVGGALWFAYRSLSGAGLGARAGMGLCVGLGLLAKGPLAGVVPAVVAAAWAVVGVPWRSLVRVAFSPVAWGVALLVAGPWYALCERANPGYLRHFLVYEHFGRFAEKGTRDFAPVWLYVVVLPFFLLPWTHLLWSARLPRPALAGRGGEVSASRLAWGWVVACLVFFSAGRNRLFTYILPAALPLFVLAGARLVERLESGGARRLLTWAVAQAGLVVAGAVALATFKPLPTVGGHVLDPRLAALGVPAIVAAVPMLFAPLFLAPRSMRTPARAGLTLTLAAAALWWGLDFAAARADDLRSSRRLADAVAAEAGPHDAVVCLDVFPQGLRWYRDVRFSVAGKQREIVPPWSDLDGAGTLLSEADLHTLWSSPRRVVLVVREGRSRPWLEIGGRVLHRDLSGSQRSDLLLIENRPRSP